jgi:hypothetical protein
MKWHLIVAAWMSAWSIATFAQTSADPAATLKPGDNLVLENVPPNPASIAEQTARYGNQDFLFDAEVMFIKKCLLE